MSNFKVAEGTKQVAHFGHFGKPTSDRYHICQNGKLLPLFTVLEIVFVVVVIILIVIDTPKPAEANCEGKAFIHY